MTTPPNFRKLLTFRLHMVARLSESICEDFYRSKLDLTLTQSRVIGIVGRRPVLFKAMVREANLEKGYASRVVASLVERDIIAKESNQSDSRSLMLRLTKYGRSIHRDLYDATVQLNERLEGPFTDQEINDFQNFLTRLGDHLEVVRNTLHEENEPRKERATRAPIRDRKSFAMDHQLAVQLHALLGQYLET